MEYAEQLLEVYHNIWIFFGTAAVILLAAAMIMFIRFRIPEIIRKRRWILLLACVLAGWAGQAFGLHARAGEARIQETKAIEEAESPEEPKEKEEAGEPEESEEPEEPEEPEDITAPEVLILWKDEHGNNLEQEAYFQTGEALFVELVIKEENLDPEGTRIYLEAFDAAGKAFDIPEVQQIHGKTWSRLKELAEQPAGQEGYCWELQEDCGLFCLRLHLKTEANYHLSAQIQDKKGNVPEESVDGYMALGNFCLDRTAPMISEQDGIILTAEHQTFLTKLINKATFGYFCQPDLTVKIQASDLTSGVGGITYVCEGLGGEEEMEPFLLTGTAEPGENLTYEEKGMKAYTVFSLPSSFQGIIRAKAWDRSEITMEEWTETKGLLIESEQMHKRTSNVKVFLDETPGGRDSFYRADVNLRFVMEDTFSGIRSIRLQAGNQEEVLDFQEEGQEIQRKIDHILTIPASENNQNKIAVSGSLTDFTGHTTELTEIPVIHIDTRPPEIKVEWLNQDVRNEKYYQADQTVRITVRERNFDPSQVQLEMEGMEAPFLTWTHQAGGGCRGSSDPKSLDHSDSCIWTSELTFDKDGEYSFGFSCQDAAGNRGSYEKTDTFVIDKTPPVLLVRWNDLEALHDYYYAEERSAVLEVKERNLCPEDLKTSIKADHKGETISGPELGQLRQWEDESWRAGITFQEDGRFQWEVHCTDLAGNEAAAYCSEEFVIDQTPPELIFEGVADCSANRETAAPRLKVTDINFDPEQTRVNLTGSNGTGKLPACAQSNEEYGFTLLWGDFEQIPENDDLYKIRAEAADLAGNVTAAELTFSVNRFGSVYELEESTALLAGPGGIHYASSEPELVITEYNPDFLEHYQVAVSREGEIAELKEGRDYRVEKAGTKDTWKTYRYQIGKENFQKEGIYLVTLYSEDRAKNASNNRIKGKSLEFTVDKTGPSIVVTGVKDRDRIRGKHLEIQADIRDAFALAGAEIYLNEQCVAAYDRNMLQDLEGMITCPVSGAKIWQTFSVKAWDEAGNLTETEPIRFLVTEQIRFRFLGDDEPKGTWAAVSAGLLLLAGVCLAVAGRIRRRLALEKTDSP